MPGCSAVNCTNSATKGFLMKRFPKDPIRRREWLVKMERDEWTPTDHSCLCEIHFAPEMWEKTREDGSRKLKISAVPTIFSFSPSKTKRKVTLNRAPLPLRKSETLSVGNVSPVEAFPDVEFIVVEPELFTSSVDEFTETTSASSEESENSFPAPLLPPRFQADLIAKLNRYEKMYFREKRKANRYKNLLRNTRRRLKNIEKRLPTKEDNVLLETGI